MKKLIAVMMALVLALGLGCAALAENPETPEVTNDNWLLKSLTDTGWIQKDGRASLEIEPLLDTDSSNPFQVTLHWADSADEATDWLFFGRYDPEIGTMNLNEECCIRTAYGDDGEAAMSENVYDRECDVTLEMDEDGLLILRGSEEEQISLLGFEPVPAAETKVVPLTERHAEVFAQATEKLLGVDYEPVGVLSEGDDMLFWFLCKATVVVPGAEPVYCLVLVRNLGENAPEAEIFQIMEDGSEG